MNYENEVWKPVVGYEGRYEVSDMGRVKSIERWRPNGPVSGYLMKEKMLSINLNEHGYALVNLTDGKKHASDRVHRLLAKAFIPNPENKREVNHKNFIRHDNVLDNLEWATSKENKAHAHLHGRYDVGEDSFHAKLTRDQVIDIKQRLAAGERNASIWRDYAHTISQVTICDIKSGRSWNSVSID